MQTSNKAVEAVITKPQLLFLFDLACGCCKIGDVRCLFLHFQLLRRRLRTGGHHKIRQILRGGSLPFIFRKFIQRIYQL